MGAMFSVINLLNIKHVTVLILNVMLPTITGPRAVLRNALYRVALRRNNVYYTVNNLELGRSYSSMLRISNRNYFVLFDTSVYRPRSYVSSHVAVAQEYVFFGGRAGRDYATAIKIAERCPNISFVFAVKRADFGRFMQKLPNNVMTIFDCEVEQFNYLLKESSLVMLPLKSDAPSGLIVLLTAAYYKKLVIATQTVTLESYIVNGKSGILLSNSDLDGWCYNVEKFLDERDEKQKMVEAFSASIERKFSNEAYLERLNSIIATIYDFGRFDSLNIRSMSDKK